MSNLELHYYLKDGKHSMDAIIKNRAEHEILKIIYEVATILEIDISIEIEAMEQGGIREIIKFFSKHKNKGYLAILIFFSSMVSDVVTGVITESVTSDSEMDSLTKEEKRLNIRKLKKELDNDVYNISKHDSIKLIKEITENLKTDPKICIHKSRFYSQIIKESAVYKFSLTEISKDGMKISDEYSIDRENFSQQIIDENEGTLVIIEDAHVVLVAPVLRFSNMKWRGIYNGKRVSFDLTDSDFKREIMERRFSFSNGTSIRCKLNYFEAIDENGELIAHDLEITDVFEVFQGQTTTYTAKYKKIKEAENQIKFPF